MFVGAVNVFGRPYLAGPSPRAFGGAFGGAFGRAFGRAFGGAVGGAVVDIGLLGRGLLGRRGRSARPGYEDCSEEVLPTDA